MSKQIDINSRPADIPAAAIGNMFGGDNLPIASVGNYKGVMLCNRPTEVGGTRKVENGSGVLPFNSRVQPEVPTGWNPGIKLVAKRERKRKSNAVL